MNDNNLDNQWRLRDLPRIAWGNVMEWLCDLGYDRAAARETIVILVVACAVWLCLAAIFYVGRFGLVGGE